MKISFLTNDPNNDLGGILPNKIYSLLCDIYLFIE